MMMKTLVALLFICCLDFALPDNDIFGDALIEQVRGTQLALGMLEGQIIGEEKIPCFRKATASDATLHSLWRILERSSAQSTKHQVEVLGKEFQSKNGSVIPTL